MNVTRTDFKTRTKLEIEDQTVTVYRSGKGWKLRGKGVNTDRSFVDRETCIREILHSFSMVYDRTLVLKKSDKLTLQAIKVFGPIVKSAFYSTSVNNIKEDEVEELKNSYTESQEFNNGNEIELSLLQFEGRTYDVTIDFVSGNLVTFSTSEWGGMLKNVFPTLEV